MITELAHRPLPVEIELAQLFLELEQRQQLLNRREAERAELEQALTQFANQVKMRVGDLKDEIRIQRSKLEEYRKLLARLKADPTAVPADVEKQMAEELEAQDEEPEIPPGFRGRAEGPADGNGRNPQRHLNSNYEEVLRIYRLLAKRHHPDLATTPAERERRTELMLRINIAFRDQNLAALQTIALEVDVYVPMLAEDRAQQRLDWTRHEIGRIDREIRVLEHRLDSLRSSDTHILWQAELDGQSALDDLERRTRERLKRERARLDEASSQYAIMAARRQVILRRSQAQINQPMAQASD